MNIGGVGAIGREYYYSPGKREKGSAESVFESVGDMERSGEKGSVSPEETYRELSGDREQKLQELGLEYVDPTKCTWVKFYELCEQVLENTTFDACALERLGITVEDETVEMDCLNYLRRWSEEQMEKGNMVGFHMGKRLSGAIANYIMDVRGETQVLEVDGATVQAKIMEDGTSLRSSHLGFAFAFGERDIVAFDAVYADDSTADNPIIEVHMRGEDGEITQVYRVAISQIDPRNATQLEMFALCVHRDKQGISQLGSYGDNSYIWGKDLGIFKEMSVSEFTEEKRDWVKAYTDKMEEIKRTLQSASLANVTRQYAIGNYLLTRKEWENMLKSMEEMWQRELEREEEKEQEQKNLDGSEE